MHNLKLLLILCSPFFASAFRFVNNANFTTCYNDKVLKLNTSDLSDPNQIFLYDKAGQRLEANRPLLSLPGCEALCNDGYGLWTLQDTLLRLVLWIFPAVILVAHFHFAPLPASNTIAVVTHLLADPIDSIWSMLTRQEANRRFYRRATTSSLKNGRPVATIWSAYEELGWQDASAYFFDSLRDRSYREGLSGKPLVTASAREVPSSPSVRVLARRATGWTGVPNAEVYDISVPCEPDSKEMYWIELAAQRITSARSESSLRTWVAIIGLGGALGGAYIRTWMQPADNQTPHTIAVVALLFIFVPLVKISGNIGAFTSLTGVVDVIQELQRNLAEHNTTVMRLPDRRPLFPPCKFDANARWADREGHHSQESVLSAVTEVENLKSWPGMASWSGFNSPWRPLKTITTKERYDYSDRSPVYLALVSFAFVILGSFLPALLLAYYTPLRGFACRSVSWTLVMMAWCLSVGADFLLKTFIRHARPLWFCTIIKDSVISVFLIGIIFAEQIGMMNSCFCRSGTLAHQVPNYIDLGPLTRTERDQGWVVWLTSPGIGALVIILLIFVTSRDSNNARQLLNRDLDDLHQGVISLNLQRARMRLHHQDLPSSYYAGYGGNDVELSPMSAAQSSRAPSGFGPPANFYPYGGPVAPVQMALMGSPGRGSGYQPLPADSYR